MRSTNSTWTAALLLSAAALLSFLARTFIDYRIVYAELNLGEGSLGLVTLLNLAFYGCWIGALVAASHGGRRAMYVLLGFNALLSVFGLTTVISLCPTPCRTAWPVGEIVIWSNLLIGVSAIVLATMSLRKGEPVVE